LEWTRVVLHGTLHRKALVRTNREGHRGLVEKRIVGGMRTTAQEPQMGAPSYGGKISVKRQGEFSHTNWQATEKLGLCTNRRMNPPYGADVKIV